MTFTFSDLQAVIRSVGRCIVFRAAVWDGATDLSDALTQLGDTEGEVTLEMNDEYNELKVEELTGPAPWEVSLTGMAPVLNIPLVLAAPALRAIVTPYGAGSAGNLIQQPVAEHTLALIPQAAVVESGAIASLEYNNTNGWQVGGDAASSAQTAALDQGVWLWRGFFEMPGAPYPNEDGGKVVVPVRFRVMQTDLATSLIPAGERLFSLGRPDQLSSAIDIHPSDA